MDGKLYIYKYIYISCNKRRALPLLFKLGHCHCYTLKPQTTLLEKNVFINKVQCLKRGKYINILNAQVQ